MDIALVRVDNRLVHGQILEAWVPFLRASCIVVVDDQVASDYFRETVIRMAVPREVEVIICGVKEFAETYSFNQGQRSENDRTFQQDLRCTRRSTVSGSGSIQLNIGNVYNEKCQLCCTPSVLLSDADIRDITTLHEEGVKIEVRRVPREKPVDLYDIVRMCKVLTDGINR